jgi:prepilin-type N-terminal cleavage/methylation domain-containing protein
MAMLTRLMRTLHRKSTGFTLIELMIVILVILILAAILVPQFSMARERARKASCISNQRNLETSVSMWATDNPFPTYAGGLFTGSTQSYAQLTGGITQYTLPNAFTEPDDPVAANNNGTDYYLSAGGAPVNPAAPSYGHVACTYAEDAGTACGGGDPWVNCYNGKGPGTTLNHTRGGSASP